MLGLNVFFHNITKFHIFTNRVIRNHPNFEAHVRT